MPPKRLTSTKKGNFKENQTIQKAFKRQSEASHSTNHPNIQEQILMLQDEKIKLLASLNKLKKEMTEVRGKKRDLEFSMLQDSTRQLETFSDFKPLVEKWSKYTGINLTEVLYDPGEDSREWSIKGEIEEEKFNLQIICKTDDVLNKGYVDNFSVECSEKSQLELQTWLSNNPGNIQQILSMLKTYYDMNKERRTGLEACKEEFGSIITVTHNETGETIVELGTDDAYYFQIKWKLVPVPRYFAKVKNHCRIACTEDGDACIKTNTDLTTVKKRLNQYPVEVIQLLARSIAQESTVGNKKRQTNKGTRK